MGREHSARPLHLSAQRDPHQESTRCPTPAGDDFQTNLDRTTTGTSGNRRYLTVKLADSRQHLRLEPPHLRPFIGERTWTGRGPTRRGRNQAAREGPIAAHGRARTSKTTSASCPPFKFSPSTGGIISFAALTDEECAAIALAFGDGAAAGARRRFRRRTISTGSARKLAQRPLERIQRVRSDIALGRDVAPPPSGSSAMILTRGSSQINATARPFFTWRRTTGSCTRSTSVIEKVVHELHTATTRASRASPGTTSSDGGFLPPAVPSEVALELSRRATESPRWLAGGQGTVLRSRQEQTTDPDAMAHHVRVRIRPIQPRVLRARCRPIRYMGQFSAITGSDPFDDARLRARRKCGRPAAGTGPHFLWQLATCPLAAGEAQIFGRKSATPAVDHDLHPGRHRQERKWAIANLYRAASTADRTDPSANCDAGRRPQREPRPRRGPAPIPHSRLSAGPMRR